MAGRLDVVTYGENDKYLSLNPESTLFHKKITKRPNFSVNYTELNPKRENIGFGKVVRFTIPQNAGDLLKTITLVVKADDIPPEWNLYYQDGAGVALIEYADLIIGGTKIERLDSTYITISNTYFNNFRQQEGIENLTGLIPSSTFSSWYGCRKTFSQKHTQKKFDFQIDLPFYFYKTSELCLPLCAITKQEVEVEIKFRDLKDILFSKTPDIYREDSANFPFPTYYDGSWIPDKNVIFLEMIKGWNRTNYSYFKYNKVPWYDNPGASMKNAKLGQNGLGIHKYAKKYTTRDYYPYSDTYEKPTWSMFDFLENTYDVRQWYDIRGAIPEHFTCADLTKTMFHSFPGLPSGSIAMRLKTGDKEFSKNAMLINPYMSTQTLEIMDTVYPHLTTCTSFSMEKTGPNMLRDAFNHQVEASYYQSTTPFTDIGKGNEKAVPVNWLNHGLVAACLELGEVFAITSGPTDGTIFEPMYVSYGRIFTPSTFPSFVNQDDPFSSSFGLGSGCIRIFRHFPVGQGYNDAWDPDTHLNSINSTTLRDRLIELENIESGKVISSDVVAEGMLELHWPMHGYARDSRYSNMGVLEPKFMSSMNEPWLNPPNYTGSNGSGNWNVQLPFGASPQIRGFGKVTRITSAGKAIVATLGYPNWPTDLRMFTWLPNDLNGRASFPTYAPSVPGYTIGSPDTQGPNYWTSGVRSDNFGGVFRLAWPNTRIPLSATLSLTGPIEGTGLRPDSNADVDQRRSDVQMSDYWETDQYRSNFLNGRTAEQDNGRFAIFWGHVRNLTVAYSYIRDVEYKSLLGGVQIYEWNFHNWEYYLEYKQDWDKTFSLVQTLNPPDTPTYNFNFGEKIAISRTSQMLIVSEPNWVPAARLAFTKTENVDWNVGRIHVYKKTSTSAITSIYNITASDGKFYVNGDENPTIELIGGVTYTFNNPTVGGYVPAHPFKFSETSDGTHGDGSEYIFNGTITNTVYPYPGAPEGTFKTTFTVPISQVGTTLYYYCEFHPGMGNSINMVEPGGRYQLHQTIYPELPSLADRTERARKLVQPLYTSWNDPIQKRWEFGKTLDLSDDDKTLIVGADSNTTLGLNKSPTETNGGWVSVYQLNDSGNFEFKSIISQKIDEDADASFGSDKITTTIDGNDIAVSASNADWEPSSELPFKDTSFDPLINALPTTQAQEDESCGNVQLFSKDIVTPKDYRDIDIEIDTCKLKLELIHLDKLERNRIKNTSTTQIITQLQLNKFNWMEYQGINYDNDFVQESQNNKFKLNFCNPVKELFFVVQKSNKRSLDLLRDSNVNASQISFFQGVTDFDGFVRNYGNRETNNVFTSSKYSQPVMESIKSLSLKLDDEEVIPKKGVGEFPSHFLRAIPSSKYHTHTALNRRIYMWSFATRPESWKPSGQLNFSTINNQILTVEGFKTGWTHQHDLSVYAKSYNIMKIENGTVRIIYPLISNGKSESSGNLKDFPGPFVDNVFNGNELVIHERYQPYSDPGITLSPDLTFDSSNNLNVNTVGSYTFEYAVVNEHGNKNYRGFTRTVNVVDTVPPVVSLNNVNANPINLIFNDSVNPVYFQAYTEYGAVADTGETIVTTYTRINSGGVVSVTTVNPTVEGVYTVTYTATDVSDNVGTATRTVNVTRDAAAPLITLSNPNANPINLVFNDSITPTYVQAYIEFGATSDDGEVVTIDSSSVNTTTPGTYTVTYSATDIVGNTGFNYRGVIVSRDTTSPMITLNTPSYNNVKLFYNNANGVSQSYTEHGATSYGGEAITTTITRSPIGGGTVVSVSSVSPTTEGIYVVTYSVTNTAGNTGTNTRTITVKQDIVAPVISLTNPNENPVRLIYNTSVTPTYSEPYVEYGATADSGETVVIDSSTVNVTSEGTYTVTYTATDVAGNIGTATRTVIVTEDDIDPIITLNNASANPINLIFNDSVTPTYVQPYIEYGATSDGETVSIDTSAIQSTTEGTYNVVYSATDTAGNTGTAIRQVTYTRDTSAPNITLNNSSYNPVDIFYNSTTGYAETYTEYGATSSGGETVTQVVTFNGTVVSAVNTSQAGTYVVTYSATDSAGNTGTNLRTITVEDDIVAPVLNLQGPSYIKVVQNYGGSLGIPNPPITINAPDQNLSYSTNSTVNMSTPGVYTITYSATDRGLNTGTVTRTIQVYSTSGATASFTLTALGGYVTQCYSYTDAGSDYINTDTTNTPVYSSGNLNTSTIGSYTVNWTATSKVLGGNSLMRSRTVTVNAISFSPSQTIEAYCSYEPLVDSQSPWNSNLTWADSTSTQNVAGRNITKITRSYRPKCNNNASQQVATRDIRNYFDSVQVQRNASHLSGGDTYTITNNFGTPSSGEGQCTIIAHASITHRSQNLSGRSLGLIGRVGGFSLTIEDYNSYTVAVVKYTEYGQNFYSRVYLPSSANNTQMIFSVSGHFTSNDPSQWRSPTSEPIYITIPGFFGGTITQRVGYNYTYYWRRTHEMKARLRVYRYTGSGTYNINTHRTNGAIGSDGLPDLQLVSWGGFNRNWTDGGNNTTTTWASYPGNQLHQPGNHSSASDAAGAQLQAKSMFPNTAVTYAAQNSYAGTNPANIPAFTPTNGNSIYVLDRSHYDYL